MLTETKNGKAKIKANDMNDGARDYATDQLVSLKNEATTDVEFLPAPILPPLLALPLALAPAQGGGIFNEIR